MQINVKPISKKELKELREKVQQAQQILNSRVRRANIEYYKKELEANAFRGRSRKMTLKRARQILRKREEYKALTYINKGLSTRWTKKEENYLMVNYMKKTYLQLACFLGRSWCAIGHKLHKLNKRKYMDWKNKMKNIGV